MASVLVIDLYVYLQQKITKMLEEEGHDVIGIYPGRDLLGLNLRRKQFDFILVASGVSPRFRSLLDEAVKRYQEDCQVITALYGREELLASIGEA